MQLGLDYWLCVCLSVQVVRDISRYTSAAQIEAEILEEIRAKDPGNRSNCLTLIARFLYDRRRGRERCAESLKRSYYKRHGKKGRKGGTSRGSLRSRRRNSRSRSCSRSGSHARRAQRANRDGSSSLTSPRALSSSDEKLYFPGIHMCLASEKLGLSLFAFLSQNQYRGFFVEDIQKISREILQALAFLRKIELTHTDLKVRVAESFCVSQANSRVVLHCVLHCVV